MTAVPTNTKNLVSSPVPASPKLPTGISKFLLRAKILKYDSFSSSDDAWTISRQGVKWVNGKMELTGTTGFQTVVARSPLEAGQAVLYLIQYTSTSTDFNFLMERGTWQTPGYYRYGLNLKSAPVADIWKGTNYLGGASFSGNLKFQAGNNYYVLLSLDFEQEFMAVVWEADNPAVNLTFRQGRAKDWPATGWAIHIQGNEGILRVDDFFIIKFDEFAF